MRKLLLGVFLGLLAVVHSTPVTTVTQIPINNNEDDVFREAMTDGFLVPSLTTETPKTQSTVEASQETSTEPSSTTADASTEASMLTTNSPKSNTTVQTSQQPDSAVSDETEGSATVIEYSWFEDDSYATTTSTQEAEASGATESMISGFDPTELPAESTTISQFTKNEPEGSGFGDSEDMSTTFPWLGGTATTTETSTDSPAGTLGSEYGSGVEESIVPAPRHSLFSDSGMIEEPTQSTTTTEVVVENDKKTPAQVKYRTPDPEQHKGHSTPGWIIIVGFIVGVAALVMLCLAIATRDKWNGPRQASITKAESNPSNQQRELEMETFLHKDEPKENGKAAEYTVIPLDELSESYS